MSTPIPPVVIVGAGPSGLLLARFLQIHHIPVKVYERDPSPSYRPQGGSLDLHDDTGLKALRETGLLGIATGYMRSQGEAVRILDRDGKVWRDENVYDEQGELVRHSEKVGEDVKGRPEIDRTDLRNILIDSLEPDTIQWSHALTSCEALSASLYQVNFVSQPSITTPYLIGADGTFSKVRPLLHDFKPSYSSVSIYDLSISSMSPKIQKILGTGMLMILGNGGDDKAVMPQNLSHGRAKVYLAMKVAEEWQDEHRLPEKGKKEWLVGLFEGWTEEAKEVIMACEEEGIVQRRIYQFDPDLNWKTDKTGVTIMGDAAHVMSPFAGEGVNQALADALELGQTLVKVFTPPPRFVSLAPFPLSLFPVSPPPPTNPRIVPPSSAELHAALRSFEKGMMRRAREEMVGSQMGLDMIFGSEEPAKAWAEFMDA
ncbi:hypothetical protein CI109_101876 [Kwoniella shandongensis]|uniref:Uncharacterized protein n=1 Tax=Kwoniella shandongensis TaxID=1734106 RepID=A0A5M6BR70_9TREE|nr:uncharacterized protein CI109_007046 [Kwoniella shandongensis]KAA5524611.1 hypothetical protein CI109_007046 [Kwoniella shandongensis]